jgi:hypothetical protein
MQLTETLPTATGEQPPLRISPAAAFDSGGRQLSVKKVAGSLFTDIGASQTSAGSGWCAFEMTGEHLKQRLARLAQEWRDGTRYTSSFTEMVMHPSYQRIIGVGYPAVSFLLQELQRSPGHWFWALNAITGENPVAHNDRGNLDRMTTAWLDWGRREGLI